MLAPDGAELNPVDGEIAVEGAPDTDWLVPIHEAISVVFPATTRGAYRVRVWTDDTDAAELTLFVSDKRS